MKEILYFKSQKKSQFDFENPERRNFNNHSGTDDETDNAIWELEYEAFFKKTFLLFFFS